MFGNGLKKSLLSSNDGEAKALDEIANAGEAMRKRVDALIDRKLSTLISHYENLIKTKNELDAAIAYYKLPQGIMGNTRSWLSSDESCLEKIAIRADLLNKTLVTVQASSVQLLTAECEAEQKELDKSNLALRELAQVKSREIINRLFRLTKTVEEAEKGIGIIDLKELEKYFDTYRAKIAAANPKHATDLSALAINLKQNIATVFPKDTLNLDAKKTNSK